jgi:endonuclease YncB( thermonuclease family)
MAKIIETPFCYHAENLRCIDGDTLELLIDCGFKHSWKVSCRLAHINAPELSTPAGQTAKAYLIGRIPVGTKLYIISKSLDKYGRPIAEVYLNGASINEEMISKGYAVKFM